MLKVKSTQIYLLAENGPDFAEKTLINYCGKLYWSAVNYRRYIPL